MKVPLRYGLDVTALCAVVEAATLSAARTKAVLYRSRAKLQVVQFPPFVGPVLTASYLAAFTELSGLTSC